MMPRLDSSYFHTVPTTGIHGWLDDLARLVPWARQEVKEEAAAGATSAVTNLVVGWLVVGLTATAIYLLATRKR